MSFIISYGSAVVLRVINAFLDINTPDVWWYFVPATLVGLGLSIIMLFVNGDKIFRKPAKKKVVSKPKVRKKSTPAVSTPEREYRRKVSQYYYIYLENTRYLFARKNAIVYTKINTVVTVFYFFYGYNLKIRLFYRLFIKGEVL